MNRHSEVGNAGKLEAVRKQLAARVEIPGAPSNP